MGDDLPAPRERGLGRPAQLIAVFVVGFALAAVRSGDVSLWTDESITISAATRTWSQLWEMLGNVDAVHGFYYAFMKLWIDAFGINEVVLRLPSALAVGATAVGVLVLARRITTPGTALTAALLSAVLPRLTWAGIEARPFAFSALAAVWATWAVVVAAELGGTWRWVRYAGLAVLGVVINVYLALLVVGHGITVLLYRRRDRPALLPFLAAAVATAVVTSPVLLLVHSQQGQLGNGDHSAAFLLRRAVVNQFFLGETPTAAATAHWFDLAWRLAALGATFVGAVVVLAAVLLPARPGDDKAKVLALTVPWVLLPTGLILVYAVMSAPIYQPRYFTFTAPAAALLLALGLRSLPRVWLRRAAASLLVATIAVVYVSQRLPASKDGSDWSRVAAVMARCARSGDAVLFEPRYDKDVVERTSRRITLAYPAPFVRLHDLTAKQTGPETGTLDGYSAHLSSVAGTLRDFASVWVIYGTNDPPNVVSADAGILEGAGFAVSGRWTGPHSRIVLYESHPPGADTPRRPSACP
jgi:mannosyltransferase